MSSSLIRGVVCFHGESISILRGNLNNAADIKSRHYFRTKIIGNYKVALANIRKFETALDVQGPSWPRILGRSDFSLQEN